MVRANEEIRRAARVADVPLWKIAEAYGCVDTTFSRKLRRELPTEEKQKIFAIISELKQDTEPGKAVAL